MDAMSDVVQPKDVKYLKRKVKSGAINVHPTEPTLIVNYSVEAVILGESENPVLSDKKDCQKLIRLKSLTKNSDCAALAREVVSKCSLIHPAKVKEVEHLICFLQSRKDSAFSGNGEINDVSQGTTQSDFGGGSLASTPEKASFSRLREYTELLYEDISDKIRGSNMIMQLAREKDNLDELAKADALVNALVRVLREDYKKSVELSANLVSVFQSFSQFSHFHPLIQEYKVGSLCMHIVEFEMVRYSEWKEELNKCQGGQVREGRKEVISRLPLPKRSATPSPAPNQRLALSAVTKSNTSTVIVDEEAEKRKIAAKMGKQDRLLRACFSLLLNVSESIKTEDKIRKRNIVLYLIQCLQRNNTQLLVIVTKFLQKLSIRVENKDEMGNLNIIEKIPKLLQMNNYELEETTLSLLFNLSFDTRLRDKMIRVGFLQKIVSLLNDGRHLKIVLKLLYNFSMDDKVKAMFPFTDSLSKLMKLVTWLEGDSEEFPLVVAVCINVSVNSRCAEAMTDNGTLDHLTQKAFSLNQPLLLKILRNLSSHKTTRNNFLAFAEDIVQALAECSDSDFLLECVGILANLPLHEIEIAHMIDKYKLVDWIKQKLIPGKTEDDLALEIVMMMGAMAGDEEAASMFCKAGLLSLLIELLQSKQEDDEMVLQIIYTFYQISRHDSSRSYLTNETEAADYVIDLMSDKNPEIKKVCDACIEYIKDENKDFDEKVKIRKFEHHNYHWLSVVENKSLQVSLTSTSQLNDSGLLQNYNLLDHSIMGSHMSLGTQDEIEIVSNHPNSGDNSRPLSRYESDCEEIGTPDSIINSIRKPLSNNSSLRQTMLHNLIIPDDDDYANPTSPLHYYHMDQEPSTNSTFN